MTKPTAAKSPSSWEGIGSRRLVAGITALAVFAALLLSNTRVAGPEPTATATPEPTPAPAWEFELEDLEGQAVKLSDLRGQVVLVNFWASWCPPCRDEMPLLQDFYLAHREQGFTLLGVNVSEDADDAAAFMNANGYQFPVWRDPPGNLLIAEGLNGLPASVLVDAEGRIVKRWIGPLAEEDLTGAVLPLLK